MRNFLVVGLLTAGIVVGNAVTLTAVAQAYVPPLKYLGSSTTVVYKAAPATTCAQLLRVAPSRATNPVGCRYKEIRTRRFFSDAVVGWTWGEQQITFVGPFGFWSAQSVVTFKYNGRSIVKESQRCPVEAGMVKIALEPNGCQSWKVNNDLAHEVDFRITYDGIPFFTLSKTYFARQVINVNGVGWANIFGP